MGIYDRDYYRREGPSFLGAFGERGVACKWLIAINVVVFVLQMLSPARRLEDMRDAGSITNWLILDPSLVMSGQIWRLLTYSFLHSVTDPGHILWNMLFLWWFGTDVEDLYGKKEFLAIYLTAAFLGGVVHTLLCQFGWYALHPFWGWPRVLGASGAVTTVLILCAIHYPRRVILLFFIFPVPIWLFIFFSVGKDFITFLGPRDTNVAVDVHLTGAAFAFLYYRYHWRLSTLWPDFRAWRKRATRPRLRVYPEDAEPTPVTAAVSPPAALTDDEQLEAKVDALLEKIFRYGENSLTESEREVLLRASERLKRRRR